MSDSSSSTDYDSMTVEELLAAKEDAINNLNIERARDIEALIQARRACDITGILNSKRPEVTEQIEAIYDTYKKGCEALKRDYEEAELNVRERIDVSFQECQKRHIEELIVIEKEYALDVIREKNRPVREQRQLFDQAKRLARMNNFEHSIMVREKANQVFEEEMLIRRQHVEEKYRGIRKLAIERQRMELQLLKKKLVGMLEAVAADLQRDIEGEWRKLSVHLRSFQKRCSVAITKDVKFNVDKKKLADGMNKMVQDIAMELTGVPLNSVVIPASPRKEQQSTAKTPRSGRKTPRTKTPKSNSAVTPKKEAEEPKQEEKKPEEEEACDESEVSKQSIPMNLRRYSVISGEGLPFSDEEAQFMDPQSD